MAKLLLVCHRDRSRKLPPELFRKLSAAIIPDNITPPPPHLLSAPGLDIGIFNPSSAVLTRNTSVCLGHLIDPGTDWYRALAPRPDGSFALFRADDRHVELVSDTCASRTIWYIQTNEMFVASTSQSAIVAVLGNYRSNRKAIAWMLSAGNLGPDLSWDCRIKCLRVNTSATLDRDTWTLILSEDHIKFLPRRATEQVHREELTGALRDVFERLRFDHATWRLLLSGGLDSRCILQLLKNRTGLRSVTWGLASALDAAKSDAAIARSLAHHHGLEHTYYTTDIAAQDVAKIFDRLLVAGEGRTDTIAAYMDGCDIWRKLFAAGIMGIIRGDAVFSPYRVYSADDVRRIDGVMFMSDYDNLAHLSGFFDDTQYWPEHLHRRAEESLSTWRDRLTYEFRAPVIWAALNEIKSSYVEIMNPLLARRVVEVIAALPDPLRDGRSLYKQVVADLSPAIPFAEHNAIENTTSILASPAVVSHLAEGLDCAEAKALLSDELIALVLGSLRTTATHRRRLPKFVRQLLPERLRAYKNRLARGRNLDVNLLALRAYIVLTMDRRLQADARNFKTEQAE
jgi:asparagine synthetase B (glutamine-hydrolysing)